MMKIRLANINDIKILCNWDNHVTIQELENAINLKHIYIAEENKNLIGWLRYNLFWDNTPFMNMLFVLEKYRAQGYGRKLVEYWEKEIKLLGYHIAMTSTASDEYAQHFYNKLNYCTVGGFMPFEEGYEIILMKKLK